jgi:putative ABC transport system permease protein
MLKNYLKIAIRHLLKDRIYSILNILGLAIGISASFLIILYMADELSYDEFHPDSERIYRVAAEGKMGENEVLSMAVTGAPLAEGLKNHIPEVEAVTRLHGAVLIFNHDNELYKEINVFYADSTFFDVLGYPLIEGNQAEVLRNPFSVVLTENTAIRYFGREAVHEGKVIGKLLKSGADTYMVTGIMENVPDNSHLDFDILVSMSTFQDALSPIWINMSYYTYLKLIPGVDSESLNNKLRNLVMQYVVPQVVAYLNYPGRNFTEDNIDQNFRFFLQPIRDIHLHSNLISEFQANSDIQYIYIFSAVAMFIIMIACINFMNLSTARSVQRAKEVGIRKTLGSDKSGLIRQFLMESFLHIAIAMLIALGLTEMFRSPFNVIADKSLSFNIFSHPWILLMIVIMTILITIIAGSYPALYLTRYAPGTVLTGNFKTGLQKSWFRNSLVVFQFMISIGLVVCTVTVYKQLNYVQNKNLGFEKENVIILNNAWDVGENKDVLKHEILKIPQVVSAGYTNRLPSDGYPSNAQKAEGENESDHSVSYSMVDYDYQETLQLIMKHGRFFSRDFPSDSSAIVINGAAAHAFGWGEDGGKYAIGKKIEMINPQLGDARNIYEVIGVVSDYNYQSLHSEIRPLSLLLYDRTGFLAVRVKPGDHREALASIIKTWKEIVPELPFDYRFLDEKYDYTFNKEKRLGTIFSVFTILAIVVACLGLFGLAAYTAAQRTKEIGIRKTMGASTFNLIRMLNMQYTKLVILAFLIGTPVSWYAMYKWLEAFAYKTDIGFWPFLLSGFAALLIAWVTVSYQSFRAAIANPVDSLRNE